MFGKGIWAVDLPTWKCVVEPGKQSHVEGRKDRSKQWNKKSRQKYL